MVLTVGGDFSGTIGLSGGLAIDLSGGLAVGESGKLAMGLSGGVGGAAGSGPVASDAPTSHRQLRRNTP